MADPVIISYAKGLLKEFPGVPEGIIDVIPVDLVVASILAVAARGPLAEPDVFHAASGARNPLRYRQLVDLVRAWFIEHPLADSQDQPITVPEWSFPGRQPGAAPAPPGDQGTRYGREGPAGAAACGAARPS